MNSSFFTVALLASFLTFSLGLGPEVSISDGKLIGSYLKSRGDRTYSAFLGIPYAKPPKRFELAEFPEQWEGVRDATKLGDECIQKSLMLVGDGKIVGSEDCLFANVYVPDKATKTNLPVMVFIHGGAFVTGSSNMIGANFFMDHDVIWVTINYRLGALGFLSSGDDGVIEGNLGLKDQHLALKWVKKNIKSFGGDPNKITIMGISAGSASVHYHVLSPLSKDLFQHAIAQSGTAHNPWAYTENPAKNAFALGNFLGCNTDSSKKLLECLRGKSAEDILSFDKKEWHLDPIALFPPTHDSKQSKQILVPESPLKLMESGNFNKIPILFTVTKDEGLLFHAVVVSRTESLRKEINEDLKRVLPITLYYSDIGFPQSQKDSISSKVKEFYFAGKEIGEETLTNLTNMYTDRWFLHGIQEAAHLHAKHATVYNAVLTYQAEISLTTFFGIKEILGVSHGDDGMYFFNADFLPKLTPNSEDEKMSILLVSSWVQFANTGKPQFEDANWMSFSVKETSWFNLNFPPEVLQNPFKDRIEFWDKIWSKEGKDEL